MSKPRRIKAAAAAGTPQTLDQVAALIRQIGDAQRDHLRRATEMNDAIAAITAEHQPHLESLSDHIRSLQSAVQTWCEAHRDDLTRGGKTKTANLITGEVQWRQRPPSVRITGAETVVQTLADTGRERYLRIKREINKDSILAEPDGVADVPGIAINQGLEDFVITPFEQF